MQIGVYAFPGMTMFHLAAPLLVFGEVGRLGLATGWHTTVWTEDGRAIRTAEGLVVDHVQGPASVASADLLVFPSWPSDLPPAGAALASLVGAAHDRGASIVGLCLGAFPVVDCVPLGGRSVVTHWAVTDQLARRRADVHVDPGRSTLITATSLRRLGRPRRWTHVCTSFDPTSARPLPLPWPATSLSRRTAKAIRRSTSTGRCRGPVASVTWGPPLTGLLHTSMAT